MEFLESLVGRPNTLKTYSCLFNKHIKPLGPVHSERGVAQAILKWRDEGLHSRTVKALATLLCQYIKWRTGKEVKAKHLLRVVDKQTQEILIEVPEKQILYSVLAEAEGTDLYLPMAIALFSGMRKGEVMGLQWKDVDLKKKLITVQRSYSGPTKNGKTRVIPLHNKLQAIFLDILEGNLDNYLETLIISKQFDPNKALTKLCKRMKIKPFTFHTLRHCFASYGLESGMDFNKIQKILGHSNLSTTVNFYWTSKFKPEEVDLTFI